MTLKQFRKANPHLSATAAVKAYAKRGKGKSPGLATSFRGPGVSTVHPPTTGRRPKAKGGKVKAPKKGTVAFKVLHKREVAGRAAKAKAGVKLRATPAWKALHKKETAARTKAAAAKAAAAYGATGATGPAAGPATPDPNQAAEDNLTAAMQALPAQYNPQRLQDATLASSNLVNAGYFDATSGATTPTGSGPAQTPLTLQANAMAHGDIVYNIVRGADGNLYRQAYMKIAHNNQSRGSSSDFQSRFDNQQMQTQLDAKREALLAKASQAQTSSLTAEGKTYTGDLDKIQALIQKGTAAAAKTITRTPQGTPSTGATGATGGTGAGAGTRPKTRPKPKPKKPVNIKATPAWQALHKKELAGRAAKAHPHVGPRPKIVIPKVGFGTPPKRL